MSSEARIDKWLWAVRIFKTRTIAAEACKKGRVSVNGAQVKPSRMVKEGEVVQVRKPPVTYSFKVLQAIEKRATLALISGFVRTFSVVLTCTCPPSSADVPSASAADIAANEKAIATFLFILFFSPF